MMTQGETFASGGDLCFELCKTIGVSGSIKKGSLWGAWMAQS